MNNRRKGRENKNGQAQDRQGKLLVLHTIRAGWRVQTGLEKKEEAILHGASETLHWGLMGQCCLKWGPTSGSHGRLIPKPNPTSTPADSSP